MKPPPPSCCGWLRDWGGAGAPREVTRLLRALGALEYGRLQMCAALGERLGQLLQQRAHWAAEGSLQHEAGAVQQPL